MTCPNYDPDGGLFARYTHTHTHTNTHKHTHTYTHTQTNTHTHTHISQKDACEADIDGGIGT